MDNSSTYPFVSICTPTFNRRPFIPTLIQCFNHQTYPKDRIEWIIVDDGSDNVEDLFEGNSQVKYFKYADKMTLGRKRNVMHEKTRGEFIIYMDDDDYYPPERISHAVQRLQENPKALCAGSSEMYIYFKHIDKLVQFGPYGPNHSTAATFAFRRELLFQTKYNETSCLAEEKEFLKNYTIPFVQLDTMKSILVFSHHHNSFDKKTLLQHPNQHMKMSDKTVDDFVKEPAIKKFFIDDIDDILDNYQIGDPIFKQDVFEQITTLTQKRLIAAKDREISNYKTSIEDMNNKFINQFALTQTITKENKALKDKNQYLEDKLREIIKTKVADLKASKSEANAK
jgi:glycosyltransferase involved in cell wall biosynthesis